MTINNETYITGALCIDAESTMSMITGVVDEADFISDKCRAVFKAAQTIINRKEPVDPVAIQTEAKAQGVDVDTAFLSECMAAVPTVSNVPAYAERLVTEAEGRRLRATLEEAENSLAYGTPVGDVQARLVQALETIRSNAGNALISNNEALDETYKHLNDLASGARQAIPTGYCDLDRALNGGLRNGGLYYLAARPGGGKTQMSLQIMDNAAKQGIRVLYISLEMTETELTERRICVTEGLTLNQLEHADADAWKKIASASQKLYDRPIQFNRISRMSVALIERLARQSKAELIIIDYLGLIQHGQGKSIYEKVTATSNNLKIMAKELKVPVLCLCQLNREAADKEPSLSELRDSGAIEQDADGVLMLWMPDGRPADEGYSATRLCMKIAKNRHGALRNIEFNWFMATGNILQADIR